MRTGGGARWLAVTALMIWLGTVALAACVDPGYAYWFRNDSQQPLVVALEEEGFEQEYQVGSRGSGLLVETLGTFHGRVEVLSAECRPLAIAQVAHQGALFTFTADGRLQEAEYASSSPGVGGQLPETQQCVSRVGLASGAVIARGPQPPLLVAFSGGPDQDIWTVLTDGSPAVQLTRGPESDQNPSWSPDGALIAFDRLRADDSSDVLTVGSSGGKAKFLIKQAFAATWSPDGRSVAYLAGAPADEIAPLMLANTDGSRPRRLADGASSIEWSPDSRHLVFTIFNGVADTQLWVVQADGRGAQLVAAGVPSGIWADDSTRIAYLSSDIHIYDVATDSDTTVKHDGVITGLAAWSPDGRWFVVDSPTTSGVDAPMGLYLLPAAGGAVRQLSQPGQFFADSGAMYARDGQWIAFLRQNSSGISAELWIMHADGSDASALSAGVQQAVIRP
jgi:Tol biopolymer transport system component